VAFTWFALIGAVVTFLVALIFRTPRAVLDQAAIVRERAKGDDRPIALRE